MNWRAVVGFEGCHEVSDTGLVRSLDKICRSGRRRVGRILSQQRGEHGRFMVCLKKDGTKKMARIHRLVLHAFVGQCPIGMEGCHGNGNASDNRLSNLRWGTPKENHADKKKHGTNPAGISNWAAKLDDESVRRMKDIRRCGVSFDRIAAYFQVHKVSAREAVLGITWGHVS